VKYILETGPNEVKGMTTAVLRENFLLEDLMQNDAIQAVYSAYERFVILGAKPVEKSVKLETYPSLKSEYFLQRREIGIINVGGSGLITVDGIGYHLDKLSCLYLGKGTEKVVFSSQSPSDPALFFMLSTPAHTVMPNRLFSKEDASPVELGTPENVNQRTIYKYIHQDGIDSCQLVMGLTVLKSGNIWNTMPPHTHDRRSEVYFYFDVQENNAVFHFMGAPDETRHLVVQKHQAIISPPWSIHSGAGTASYSFIWGMGGENKDFTDMDLLDISHIK
jgi:4-deoxy-L-threo-5-hexosulose-uronate ketol-isomerase